MDTNTFVLEINNIPKDNDNLNIIKKDFQGNEKISNDNKKEISNELIPVDIFGNYSFLSRIMKVNNMTDIMSYL